MSKIRQTTPFTVRGVVYSSLKEFAKAMGWVSPNSIYSTRAEHNLSTAEACEKVLSDLEHWEALKEAKKAKAIENKAKAEKAEQERIVRGPYTPVSVCTYCDKVHARGKASPYWYTGNAAKQVSRKLCSDECRALSLKEQRTATRAKMRADGRLNRGGRCLRDRAKKVGVKIERGITAERVALKYACICQMCGEKVEKHYGRAYQPKGWTVGHIIPNSKGGPLAWDNVWLECAECNTRKGDRILERFAFMAAG